MAEQPKSAAPTGRPTPMFNIPDPNPLRGNNILIEMNATAARLLCDVLDEIDLNSDSERPLFAFKKHIRRYYGQIAENRKAREAATVRVVDPVETPAEPAAV